MEAAAQGKALAFGNPGQIRWWPRYSMKYSMQNSTTASGLAFEAVLLKSLKIKTGQIQASFSSKLAGSAIVRMD
jgi:3-methyladenine DNA glycosylase Mpg